MKIGIIGHGVIGQAITANIHPPHEVLICDPAQPGRLPLEEVIVREPDLFIVAVGTPASRDGTCDTAGLAQVLDLSLSQVTVPVIVHSTAPPTFYREHLRPHMVYIPEFVTAAGAVREYGTPPYLIVGGSDHRWRQRAAALWQNVFGHVPNVHGCDAATASLVKYLTNSMLALKVAYLNEVCDLAEALGIEWENVTRFAQLDPRLGTTHWQVPGPDGQRGYGGMCFPKDVAALLGLANRVGVDLEILGATHRANDWRRASEE